MAKKIKKVQVFRHLVQIVLFFLLPGLYIMAFSELKSIYQMIIKGNFNLMQVLPSSVEFISLTILTIVLSRFFCGWMCAFGAYNDLIHEISKKVFNTKYRVNEKADSVPKYLKYIVLAVIIALSWTIGSSIFTSASPWDAFGQITDLPEVISSLTIGLILLVLITVGAFYIERFFCRYLCPLGALFNIFSKVSIFKISMPKDKCGNCRACTSQCSMGIPLYKKNEVRGGECINCLKCVEVCPRRNAKANILDMNVNSTLASSVAVAACVGVYSINGLGAGAINSSGVASAATISANSNTASDSSSNQSDEGQGTSDTASNTSESNGITTSNTSAGTTSKYKDGTYTGTGTGFRGGTTVVSVTISGGKITSINTLSDQDTSRFYQRAYSILPDEIISAQSTSVDAVTGATFSSRGIMEAVANALSKAM